MATFKYYGTPVNCVSATAPDGSVAYECVAPKPFKNFPEDIKEGMFTATSRDIIQTIYTTVLQAV